MFVKPSDLTLYRDRQQGGLGLQHTRCRAQALLMRTFLERAAHPQFRHSLYAESLYRANVLDEWCGAPVPASPYYDDNFFASLRRINEETAWNLPCMTVKQLYQELLQLELCAPATESSPPVLLPLRMETLHPAVDWPNTWRLASMRGLPSNLSSFAFRFLHDLLPTQERIARFGANRGARNPGACRRCTNFDITETREHALQLCPSSLGASAALLTILRTVIPGLTAEALMFLSFPPLDSTLELPVVTTLLTGYSFLWQCREAGKVAEPLRMRGELEASAYTLQHSKHHAAAGVMTNMLQSLPV